MVVNVKEQIDYWGMAGMPDIYTDAMGTRFMFGHPDWITRAVALFGEQCMTILSCERQGLPSPYGMARTFDPEEETKEADKQEEEEKKATPNNVLSLRDRR